MDPRLLSPRELTAELGAALRDERLRQDLTQTTLARRAGVSRATVQRLERDGTATLVHALAVVSALGRAEDLRPLLDGPAPAGLDELTSAPSSRPERRRGRR